MIFVNKIIFFILSFLSLTLILDDLYMVHFFHNVIL